MRYIALPSNTKFGEDEYGCEVRVPASDKPWMIWDQGLGEVHAFVDTEKEAEAEALALSKIDEDEWKRLEEEWYE